MSSTRSLTDVLLLPIERPRCVKCGTRMNLSDLALRSDRSEQRTFECTKCNRVETRLVADPLHSEEMNRLADSVRPPA
jgi:hypothetical protein